MDNNSNTLDPNAPSAIIPTSTDTPVATQPIQYNDQFTPSSVSPNPNTTVPSTPPLTQSIDTNMPPVVQPSSNPFLSSSIPPVPLPEPVPALASAQMNTQSNPANIFNPPTQVAAPGGFPFGTIPTGGLSTELSSTPSSTATSTTIPEGTSPIIQSPSPETPVSPIDQTDVQAALSPTSSPQTINNTPTDLSHLIDQSTNANPNSIYTPATLSQQPETLIVPTGDPAVVENTSGGSVPKWLIGIGVVLLISVAAASAYFILGIGKNTSQTTSIPAIPVNTPPQLQAPPTIAPLPTTPSAESPDDTSFGNISATQSAQATSSGRQSATSIINQRKTK